MSAVLPFNLKKTIKPSVCAVNRCTDMTAEKLCAKHKAQWEAAGKPELVNAPPAPGSGTAIEQVPPERQTELSAQRTFLELSLAVAQKCALETDEQIARAQAAQNQAHEIAKALKTEKESATKPLKGVIKTIAGWFDPNIDTAEAIKTTFSTRIGAALREREQKRLAALNEIQAGAGIAPASAFIAAHANTSAPEGSGGLIETVTVEVVDFSLLPDEYKILVVNTPKLDAVAKANPKAEIPGVRITVSTKTRVGR